MYRQSSKALQFQRQVRFQSVVRDPAAPDVSGSSLICLGCRCITAPSLMVGLACQYCHERKVRRDEEAALRVSRRHTASRW